MCGRTGLGMNKSTLRCACSYKPRSSNVFRKPDWLEEHNDGKTYTPSYNIAPTDVTPVLVAENKFKSGADGDSRVLKPMMWGIIPPWHKEDYKNHGLSTNNCRLEGIKSSKLYGPALKNGGRCVIVIEGFYEWQTTKKTVNKQPYYIHAQQNDGVKIDDTTTWNSNYTEENGWQGMKLMHVAGVYNVWQNNDTIIYSYSVITMESNSTLDWLHHRMPAILNTQDQIEAWLNIDKVDVDMALSYLTPVKHLSWHPVSRSVNNSRNKSNDCNKRISLNHDKPQKTITSWFTREKRKSDSSPLESKKYKTET